MRDRASDERVIYEVNLAVHPDAVEELMAWLPGHIREVLACDGFLGAEWFDAGPDEAGAAQFSVRYTLRDRTALDAYFAGPAAALRAEGQARFGGRFTATRRVMRRVGAWYDVKGEG